AAERHARAAVHLPRLRGHALNADHVALRDLRITRDRHADDLRLAVAQRDEFDAPQDLAVAVRARRPVLARLALLVLTMRLGRRDDQELQPARIDRETHNSSCW